MKLNCHFFMSLDLQKNVFVHKTMSRLEIGVINPRLYIINSMSVFLRVLNQLLLSSQYLCNKTYQISVRHGWLRASPTKLPSCTSSCNCAICGSSFCQYFLDTDFLKYCVLF